MSSGDDSTLLVWETSTGVVRVWFYLQKVLQACNSTLQHRKLLVLNFDNGVHCAAPSKNTLFPFWSHLKSVS